MSGNAEHICAKCVEQNPYPQGSTLHQAQQLWLETHRLGWAIAEAWRIPQIVDWLNRRLGGTRANGGSVGITVVVTSDDEDAP